MEAPQRVKPQGNGWEMRHFSDKYTAYQSGNLCALSSTAFISDEHLPPHWEWLISFSSLGQRRLNDADIAKCLKDFGAEDFEEDNHEHGIARKFWKACEEQYRKRCPCKNETVITEGDYQYSIQKE